MLEENMIIHTDRFNETKDKFDKHIYDFISDYGLSPMEMYLLMKPIADEMLKAALSDEPVQYDEHVTGK